MYDLAKLAHDDMVEIYSKGPIEDRTREMYFLCSRLNTLGASVMLNMYIDSPTHDSVSTALSGLVCICGNTVNGGWDEKATIESARGYMNK